MLREKVIGFFTDPKSRKAVEMIKWAVFLIFILRLALIPDACNIVSPDYNMAKTETLATGLSV